jgi:glycosyltransferase involved in cell wall biosynthesis
MALRIAHVANEPFGLEMASGVQHAVYCLAHAQAEAGESVAVFSRDDHAVHVLGDSCELPRRNYVDPHPPQSSLRERLLWRHFERRLADDILAWSPDVVHFHSVHIPRNVALAVYLRRVGVPYCVTVHGGLFPAALRRHWLKKSIFSVCFERPYLNEAEFIHALSRQEADVIRRHGVRRPIVTVPNGLPPGANIRPTHPDALYADRPWLRDRHVFMFIGRLDTFHKGLDLLVRAFAHARLHKAALVLVGPDYRGSRRRLSRLAERVGILSSVVFIEAAFGPDRANLFAAADLFVHPSRWEGVSLSVLAAAAAGKPCLITREADPLGELERAQAALIVDANVSSIAAALRTATILDRQQLDVMGASARRVAESQFSWPKLASKLVQSYQAALARLHQRCATNQHSKPSS